ncbi:MAG: GntR family transcriptional regulator [Oscillospiraceae bacterium]|nr:GntR family transcriptional regulator [Oscillospiraceae bacterium]
MQRQYTVQVSSVQEMVYRTLRDKIVSMELKPGTTISTQEIADSMSVSRTPVREAFIRLQREDLLDVTPQRSTVVSKINMDRVYQERFIREALEIEVAQKFIEVATPEVLARMRRNIEKQYAAIEEQRYVDYLELDNALHQTAFTETHEDLGRSIVQQMNGHYDRIRLISAWEGQIVYTAMQEHEKYVDYIERKDALHARKLLRSHLQALRMQEEILLTNWSEYFNDASVEALNQMHT